MKPVLICLSVLVAVVAWTIATSSSSVAGSGCHGPTLAAGCAGQSPVVAVSCAGPLRSILVRGVERRQERRALRRARRAHRRAYRGCYGVATTGCNGHLAVPACHG